jgi:hypothetical protein
MKIVKEGQLPDPTLEGTCGSCGCEVECQPDDPEVHKHDDGDGYRKVCQCPTKGCPHKITLYYRWDGRGRQWKD